MIKHGAKILTGANGSIMNAIQAKEILQIDRSDLIFFARELQGFILAADCRKLGVEIASPTIRTWSDLN